MDSNDRLLDQVAAASMWAEYSRAHPDAVKLWQDYTIERIGDSRVLTDALLHEVNHGRKRATVTLDRHSMDDGQPVLRVGSH
ncbi:hypothetical protein [Paeniglutamicibacter sp.]|uniref:hypothetical protein n=1 Tax=Paeniglutamicibacter sp. TaxID=1934391 RepID=UPI003988BCDC